MNAGKENQQLGSTDSQLTRRDLIHRQVRKSLAPTAVILIFVTALLVTLHFLKPPDLRRSSLETAIVELETRSESYLAFGELQSLSDAWMISPADSNIVAVYFRPGQQVSAGDLILQLDDEELSDQFRRAEIALLDTIRAESQARQDLDLLLLQAETDLNVATAEAKLAAIELDASQDLNERGVISELQMERTKARATTADEVVNSTRESLRQLRSMATTRESEGNELVSRRQAIVDELNRKLQSLAIRAPISGTLDGLDEERLRQGLPLDAGDRIGRVVDTTKLFASLKANARNRSLAKIGAIASVDILGQKAVGRIVSIDPTIVDQRFGIRVEFDDELPSVAYPSLRVDARITIEAEAEMAVVSRPSYVTNVGPSQIYVIDEDAKLVRRIPVVVSEIFEDKIVCQSGCMEGDIVVISLELQEPTLTEFRLIDE